MRHPFTALTVTALLAVSVTACSTHSGSEETYCAEYQRMAAAVDSPLEFAISVDVAEALYAVAPNPIRDEWESLRDGVKLIQAAEDHKTIESMNQAEVGHEMYVDAYPTIIDWTAEHCYGSTVEELNRPADLAEMRAAVAACETNTELADTVNQVMDGTLPPGEGFAELAEAWAQALIDRVDLQSVYVSGLVTNIASAYQDLADLFAEHPAATLDDPPDAMSDDDLDYVAFLLDEIDDASFALFGEDRCATARSSLDTYSR